MCRTIRISDYSDQSGFKSPSIITGDIYQSDLLLSYSNDSLYVAELTVGHESNFENNVQEKKAKYRELIEPAAKKNLKTLIKQYLH